MLKIAMIDTIGDEILDPGDHQKLFTEVGDGALLIRASHDVYPYFSGKAVQHLCAKPDYSDATHLVLNYSELINAEILALLPRLKFLMIPRYVSEEELASYAIDYESLSQRDITMERMEPYPHDASGEQLLKLRKEWVRNAITQSCTQEETVTQS